MEAGDLAPELRFLLGLLGDHTGRRKAVTIDGLRARFVQLFPCSKSEFRILKERLIESGHPVCSGPEGWYLPSSIEEGEAGARFHEMLASDHHHKAKMIREACMRLFGPQLALPGLEGGKR